MPHPVTLPLLSWARRLRHPTLFKLAALLFAVDLVVPDMVPFADEILLGLGTLLLAGWKDRRARPLDAASGRPGR
jgi:hypothetical protein